ncbi:MAG: TIGR03668 family PPOX class F420-dependent oxidoreductase [Candidatus Limnocylindria bacterium]
MPDDLLATARVARLATSDQYARPHVVPIVFVYEHPHLYTPIDSKPKKVGDWRHLRRVRNVVTNGRASVVVDLWDEDWSKLRYVLLEGTADVLESGEERDRAVALLEAKYGQYARIPLGEAPVIRMTVERRIDWSGTES